MTKNEAMSEIFCLLKHELAKIFPIKKYIFGSFSAVSMNQNKCIGAVYCCYIDSFSAASALQKFVF